MADIKLTINGKECTAPEGSTILQAAELNGIHIPKLCYLEGINQYGACRICVVEQVSPPAKNLQASCMVEAKNGMVINTNNERVQEARRTMYELLLSNHDKKCLTCPRNQDCEFQALGRELGVEDSPYEGERVLKPIDVSESLTRDPNKCILCRRCVNVCKNIQTTSILTAENRGFQTIITPGFGLPIGNTACTFCGQCVVVCPVGALRETSHKDRVLKALNDPTKHVVVQPAPAVRVGIGECFGLPAGSCETGKLAAALRRMGFDEVFDTNWGADLTIMEEGTEFLSRFRSVITGGVAELPMLTSCSPGWIQFIEHNFPDELDHLSSCKSPHEMFGAVVKSYYAKKIGKKPEDMYVVSIMPCTAKKTECARPEMQNDGVPNVDAVLTTRELGDMIKTMGIDFLSLPDEEFDAPLGFSTGAADIFGVTGGVMEAALRTVYEIITGRELPFPNLHVSPIVGLEQIREATIKLENVKPEWKAAEGFEVNIAVTSGYDGARKLMNQVKDGTSPYHFIEVMGCPGGCITGGGQPRPKQDINVVRQKRMEAIYGEDERKLVRKSHENQSLLDFYKEWGEPGGHNSHEYLHTHYVKRGKYNELTKENFVVNK
ncbi:MAG: NADH-dependent [FeFe] hydrogenase, group A6 [Clostridiales bacterium]|uniref:NADH-dependent [FeFe] hydrogenase, group A6 n=1 Tax=Evtepia sp. TaxID=2773933 RepID=UPI00298750FE|nr:NADH-dependent [FeFe] hydrogenase, group A6 [Evtepia sp.]MDD7289355.1 NADH-dependent [FeFe] hydrogenase, group A6 [Clostridiales bacterium]MDY3993753.1 NADH-dependent [FeFe] hydrogenase, group A6 [Evtepia sp.]MDY4429695.1 NADH-dependent [FeFe] hydrogenase, group A6 [Evtepia sp.]